MKSFTCKRTFITTKKRLHEDSFFEIYIIFLVGTYWVNILVIVILLKKFTIWLQFYAPKFNMIIKSCLKSPRFFFGCYSLTWRHSMIIFIIITLRRTSSSSVFKSKKFNASTCTRIPISQNGLQLVDEILIFFFLLSSSCRLRRDICIVKLCIS